jgi:hypothetical protein
LKLTCNYNTSIHFLSFLCCMKLLLCINRFSDFKLMIDRVAAHGDHAAALPDPLSGHFIYSVRYLQHEIDICATGYGLFQSAYKITKTITQKKYHLALKVSLCNAYKPDLQIGEMVNVIKDKPGDLGSPATILSGGEGEEIFADAYDLGWLDREGFPHFKGAFINMNNSYMNVMMPFRKVVSATVSQYGDTEKYTARRDRYKADIETTDGLGFVYACMCERQPFYQLCCVERNLATGANDPEKAASKMNEILFDILQKL